MLRVLMSVTAALLVASVSAQTPVGDEFRINAAPLVSSVRSNVASSPDGRTVVIWMADAAGGTNFDIYGRRYAPDGTPDGPEFRVNTNTTGAFRDAPAVSMGPDGRFVVVWRLVPTSGVRSIRGRRFGADGQPMGDEFSISPSAQSCAFPDVAMATDGRFLVVYECSSNPPVRVFATPFSALGATLGPPTAVFVADERLLLFPRVAARPDGTGYVVISSSNTSSQVYTNVPMRIMTPQATFGGPEVLLDTSPPGGIRRYNDPDVAVDPQGNVRVVYTTGTSGDRVELRAFTPTLSPLGTALTVMPSTPGFSYEYPRLVSNGAGAMAITWQQSQNGPPDIGFRAYRSDFSALGPAIVANTFTGGSQFDPAVSLDDAGRALVVWTSAQQNGFQSGIYGQRFGGLPVDSEIPPTSVDLSLNVAPNPIGAGTGTVRYRLEAPGVARLTLVDALGRTVHVLADGARAAGEHTVGLDARGLAPGAYAVRLATGTGTMVHRLSVVR